MKKAAPRANFQDLKPIPMKSEASDVRSQNLVRHHPTRISAVDTDGDPEIFDLIDGVRSVGEEAIDPCIPRRHTPCTQHDARRQNQFFHRLRKSSVHTPTARKKTEKRWRRKLILSTGIRNSLGIKQTTARAHIHGWIRREKMSAYSLLPLNFPDRTPRINLHVPCFQYTTANAENISGKCNRSLPVGMYCIPTAYCNRRPVYKKPAVLRQDGRLGKRI